MQLRCAPAGISPTPDAISRQDVPFSLGITLIFAALVHRVFLHGPHAA